ncbi:MAG: HAMP domain-containing histidine kinase, partial [Verrucomicrobiaceae bacterium]
PPPLRRLLLHTLWVVVPFCLLAGLSWSAWRADSRIRENRLLDAAGRGAERALEEGRNALGIWTPVPERAGTGLPPVPADDSAAEEAWKRYAAGDYEGVLGSADTVRSEAGLPLRSLAALQLLRSETDPVRLAELAAILTTRMDFVSPSFLEEAERRFVQLGIQPPPEIANWRVRWDKLRMEEDLASRLGERVPVRWMDSAGKTFLVETDSVRGNWRVNEESSVRALVEKARMIESGSLADGLGISISVAGRRVAGDAGLNPVYQMDRGGWRCEVVVIDESAYKNAEITSRNIITAVIAVAGAAVAVGLVLAGRSYLRAVELARRQSEFMAAVSHEMRTPLAAMQLLAESLESGVADRSGQRAEHTRMIREESARLGDLVGNVLAFTREGRPEPHEAFDVGAMVADAASLIGPMAERRGVKFDLTVADFPEPPSGDFAALRRAVLNLLDNALKHTPGGGRISCEVRHSNEGGWCVVVGDSGPGVPLEERVRIFEAFYRVGDELRR